MSHGEATKARNRARPPHVSRVSQPSPVRPPRVCGSGADGLAATTTPTGPCRRADRSRQARVEDLEVEEARLEDVVLKYYREEGS